jgi:L-seryl-tRNA(Ser) seleniumtransferase
MTTPPDEPPALGPKTMLSRLPSIDRLIRSPECAALVARHGATFVTGEARALLGEARARMLEGADPGFPIDGAGLCAELRERCARRLAPRMLRVHNLTGTVLHTNLGRAVLPQQALEHIAAMMTGPNNLEFDLGTGRRGDRDEIVEDLLCEITGAQAATVVNNNAAAVLLTIAALARDREVIVSRGELVEIGGAFRMPDVMASAGARLVEVGTTNRTHLADYARGIGPDTAMLMKVHTSNYAIQGFTSSVSEEDLAPLARARGVLLATDLGSGSLVDMTRYGLPAEPTPQRMLAAGCDVVTFSGDKLLGGPQAGLIVGTREAVERIRKFPMKRALRVSKLPLAALEATLRLYLTPERLGDALPTLRWLTRPREVIAGTAHALLAAVGEAVAPRYRVEVVELSSQIGSGSLPVDRLPSAGLAIAPALPGRRGAGTALERLASALRDLPTPVIGRIDEDRLLLDCRCVDDVAPLLALLPGLKDRLDRQ